MSTDVRDYLKKRWDEHSKIRPEITNTWTPPRMSELSSCLEWWEGRSEDPQTLAEFRVYLTDRLAVTSPHRPVHAEIAVEYQAIHAIVTELLEYIDQLFARAAA